MYLDYTEYLVDFQWHCRNIHNLGILSNEDLDFAKTRTKETDLCSYCKYNNNVPQHQVNDILRKAAEETMRSLKPVGTCQ